MPTKLDEAYYEVTIRETKAIDGAAKVEAALNKKIPDAAEHAEKSLNVAFGKMGEASEVAEHTIIHAFGRVGKEFLKGGLVGIGLSLGIEMAIEFGHKLLGDSEAAEKLAESLGKAREQLRGMTGDMLTANIERDTLRTGRFERADSFASSGVADKLAYVLDQAIERPAKKLRERFGIGIDEDNNTASMKDVQEKEAAVRGAYEAQINEHIGQFLPRILALDIGQIRQHGGRDISQGSAVHALADIMTNEDRAELMKERAKATDAKEQAMKRFPGGQIGSTHGGMGDFLNQVSNPNNDPNEIARLQLIELQKLNGDYEPTTAPGKIDQTNSRKKGKWR